MHSNSNTQKFRRDKSMNTHIVLLRAVNVGGHGKIAVADIRGCLNRAGFANVQTVLQSGNVVVGSDEKKSDAVEAMIEAANHFLHNTRLHVEPCLRRFVRSLLNQEARL